LFFCVLYIPKIKIKKQVKVSDIADKLLDLAVGFILNFLKYFVCVYLYFNCMVNPVDGMKVREMRTMRY